MNDADLLTLRRALAILAGSDADAEDDCMADGPADRRREETLGLLAMAEAEASL